MLPKPAHLAPEYASVFQETSVVDAYAKRPPYPSDTFGCLARLAAGTPRTVLDVGCGTGDLALPLAQMVDRVDAIDISAAMIDRARTRAGARPNITWDRSSAEDADVSGPYALIVAGESLHWMAWDVVLPRFADVLQPGAMLAIVGRDWEGPPALTERIMPLIGRYSTNRDYRPYNLIDELQTRDLFLPLGRYQTQPVPWRPTAAEYILCRHSQNGLARERMGADAEKFDTAARDVLEEVVETGAVQRHGDRLELAVYASVVWGKPLGPQI